MQTQRIQLHRLEARDLYREYKKHQHYSKPIDREIQRTYQLIAQGSVVIRALESIKAAGADADGYPKLAIGRADRPMVYCDIWANGEVRFAGERWPRGSSTRVLRLPAGSMPRRGSMASLEGQTPLVPIHLRPKRGLQNYHVLWEAEWRPMPAGDPMLLRRIGRSDCWLVAAAWDLTEVERAALATRIGA